VLELLFAEGAARAPLVVLPHLPGAGVGALVRPLLDCAAAARRRVLPAPRPDAPAAAARRWYRDLWLTLPERERAGLVLASGPGAVCLATVADRPVEVVAVVREPAQALAALAASGARLPRKRALSELEQEEGSPREWLRAVSNPQARALLLAWAESEDLPVTLGPPPEADRWRGLLVERTAAMQVVQRAEFPALAHELGGRLECPPEQVAASVAQLDEGAERVRNPHSDHLLALNWLDAELYERACMTHR
jgi:hypothetical protein